jgi:1-acyl-sn-glycerol-3-phosphate acyltransferase
VIRPHPPPPFVRLWALLYAGCYAIFASGVGVFLRALFRVRRTGPQPALPAGGMLVCSNHQSYLDPAFVQLVFARRLTFVMTNDFYRVKKANWFFRLVGAMPVAPGRMAWATMRRAAALLRLGHAVVVFPEGRLSEDGTLHPFQRGVAVLVRRARVPVVPVAIEGSRRAWPKGAKWVRRADVRLAIGAPLHRADDVRDGDQAFADRMHGAIASLRAALPPSRL